MALVNQETALKMAKDLTIVAIEHSMIKADTDPVVTAENIATFYKTLVNKFRDEN